MRGRCRCTGRTPGSSTACRAFTEASSARVYVESEFRSKGHWPIVAMAAEGVGLAPGTLQGLGESIVDSINDALAAVLQTVRTPGDYCAAGHCALHVPLIEVDGVGPIALPLLPSQCAQLIAVAERAPYGRGGDTLVDTATLRCAGRGRSVLIVSVSRASIGLRCWKASSDAQPTGWVPASAWWPSCTSCWSTTRAASSSAIATPRRQPGCSPR